MTRSAAEWRATWRRSARTAALGVLLLAHLAASPARAQDDLPRLAQYLLLAEHCQALGAFTPEQISAWRALVEERVAAAQPADRDAFWTAAADGATALRSRFGDDRTACIAVTGTIRIAFQGAG